MTYIRIVPLHNPVYDKVVVFIQYFVINQVYLFMPCVSSLNIMTKLNVRIYICILEIIYIVLTVIWITIRRLFDLSNKLLSYYFTNALNHVIVLHLLIKERGQESQISQQFIPHNTRIFLKSIQYNTFFLLNAEMA